MTACQKKVKVHGKMSVMNLIIGNRLFTPRQKATDGGPDGGPDEFLDEIPDEGQDEKLINEGL